MRLLPNSTGVLSVATPGGIINDKSHSGRLRISRSDSRPEVRQQCLKLIDDSGNHKY